MHLLHYLLIFLMLVNEHTVHSLFMLVHSALTNVNNTTCDFNNALVNAEININ